MSGGRIPVKFTEDDTTAIESDRAKPSVAEGEPVGFESEEDVSRETIPLIGGSLRPHRFALALAAVAVGALFLRVSYVLRSPGTRTARCTTPFGTTARP